MIYFIQTNDNRYIKIGKARDAEKRLQELQISFPEPLKLLAVHQGYTDEERMVHQRFRFLRAQGEWFRSTGELLTYALKGASLKAIAGSQEFCDLARIEPGLFDLACAISMVVDDGGNGRFCANDIWYQEFKPQLEKLAGWEARSLHPQLRTTDAYDLAYDALYEMLPNCRECSCL